MNLDISKIRKAYFIGIGGIGISALAQMLVSLGVEVAGVNDDPSPETLGVLKEKGVEVTLKQNFTSLPESDIYIYSDAWLFRGPEIIEEAKRTGKPVMSFFEALGEVAKDYKVVAISGTHGKSTTTAMVAKIAIDAGLDPTVILGSLVKDFGNTNFRARKARGSSHSQVLGFPSSARPDHSPENHLEPQELLIIEADEYNRHMLNFHPFIGAVTNIEADHLDVYKDLDDIKGAFRKFAEQSEISITEYTEYLDKVPTLKVPGNHNRQNAALALAIASHLGVELLRAQESLAEFTGTWRRLEQRGVTKEGTIIYDDYAHHPTEVRASLQALRELYPEKKITIVFQPHMYSRTRDFFDEFVEALSGVAELYLLPIFYAREEKDESVSSERIAKEVNEKGGNARAFRTLRVRKGI